MRVQHRHIIYVQGYDPRGLAQYYRMFRTELRKFGRLYQLDATISGLKSAPDGETASWSIETRVSTETRVSHETKASQEAKVSHETKGSHETQLSHEKVSHENNNANWQTRTDYDFLRFEDLIQRDLQWPIWRTVGLAMAIYWRLVFSGTIARFWKAHWRFATFISYPHFLLFNEAIWSAAAAAAFGMGLAALGIPGFLSLAAAAAAFVAVLGAILKYTERLTYLLYLLSDTIFTWQFSHRQRPEWDQRIERFARHLVGVARTTRAQEIVVVGHSSGSFLGVDIVARALELDPDLGRHGPRIVLLTLGGNLPIVGFHAAATGFREHLRRLAVEPSIDWIDCQSRKDVMNFHPFDPIAGHGIDVGASRRNPTIVGVRFRDIIKPGNYNRFRWKFFRVHFQFVMANERPHAYDFFMIGCGPVPLRERMADPAAALALATGDAATRENAWKRLETGPVDDIKLTDPGQLEPSARLRG